MNDASNPRAVIGGNNPPSLREELAERYTLFAEKIDEIIERAEKLPREILSDADDKEATNIGVELVSLERVIDEARKVAVKPHLEAQRETNAFFSGMIDPLTFSVGAITRRIKTWRERKNAEEQARQRAIAEEARQRQVEADARAKEAAQAGRYAEHAAHQVAAEANQRRAEDAEAAAAEAEAPKNWTHRITDRGAVDCAKLAPYFTVDELDKAIRGYIKAGGRQLAGVEITPDTKVSLRKKR